jgi:hypothetical protein
MKNYTVMIDKNEGLLRIAPPIGYYDGMEINFVLLLSPYGDVMSVITEKDALLALYDEYQTNENIKEGDTFTFRGESEPFARAESVHIVPLRDIKL